MFCTFCFFSISFLKVSIFKIKRALGKFSAKVSMKINKMLLSSTREKKHWLENLRFLILQNRVTLPPRFGTIDKMNQDPVDLTFLLSPVMTKDDLHTELYGCIVNYILPSDQLDHLQQATETVNNSKKSPDHPSRTSIRLRPSPNSWLTNSKHEKRDTFNNGLYRRLLSGS
jgi:hypothetical protein